LTNVIIESQAAGVPVVATDLFAIPETVVHEEAGLLVIPRDAMALKNAMARLLDEPALAKRLARQGWKDAHARFDVQANVDRLLLNFERIHNDA
jgi:glycosyltransferase involved in cell wall biosynthesis